MGPSVFVLDKSQMSILYAREVTVNRPRLLPPQLCKGENK